MEENEYYNGTKLLNSKDKFGKIPEIYAVDGNRTAGKTTYWLRYCVNRFLKYREKFVYLVRFQNELPNVEDRIFKDIKVLFFPTHEMSSRPIVGGNFRELFLSINGAEEISCGYAIPINSSGKVKNYSHFFSDATRIFFDEFQAKDYKYCPDEAGQLMSIHMSLGRGHGEAVKYLPVIMCANHISSLNPYYRHWGVCNSADNLKNGFLKGDGFVIEKNMNMVVAQKQMESGFNRAFAGSREIRHAIDNEAVEHNNNFIEKVNSNNIDYLCNIIVDGVTICLKRINDVPGIIYYFSNKYDPAVKSRFVINSMDHDNSTLLLGAGSTILKSIRFAYDKGLVRFSDLETKDKAFAFLAITI